MEDDFYKILKNKFLQSLSYLKLLSGADILLPQFSDSNPEMNYWSHEMTSLAQDLFDNEVGSGVSLQEPIAIRIFDRPRFRLFFFRGEILANDQPGHAHADAFTFCLNVNGLPCIVDPGVSTYERGDCRSVQRSTAMHNTVFVSGCNSADVWAGFRVGSRPSIVTLNESSDMLDYKHDGYFNSFKFWHRRRLFCQTDEIVICDELEGVSVCDDAYTSLHFHPDAQVTLSGNEVIVRPFNMRVMIEGGNAEISSYDYCIGFHKIVSSQKIIIKFNRNKIKLIIRFSDG
ncbi:MAG: heparinase II/III-family protein [Chitinophagaceae bacterium]